MKIQLSDHFTYRKLLRFTMPSIIMMIFTSVYNMVDGLFISNFVGITPFAAINLIMPYLMAFGTLGFMVGTGGTALISSTLGMGKKEEKSVYYQTHLWLSPVFPYVKPSAIQFDLVPGDEKHTLVFHHGGNESLADDAPALGGLMPEGLADRWNFEIEE